MKNESIIKQIKTVIEYTQNYKPFDEYRSHLFTVG